MSQEGLGGPPGTTPCPSRLSFLGCLFLSLLFIVLFAFSAPQSSGLPPVGSLQGRDWPMRDKHVDWKGEGTSPTCPGERPHQGLGCQEG